LRRYSTSDQELIDWLQKFCGYLLTGSTQEHIFLFLHGHGANGKSVFIELLKHVMGDYARAIASKRSASRSATRVALRPTSPDSLARGWCSAPRPRTTSH
jgi:phage/plasmid-associated DNA primase